MKKQIGILKSEWVDLLELNFSPNQPIFIGDTNIKHMVSKHPKDYQKYGKFIDKIVNEPDYIGKHKSNGSIELVKEFKINSEYVKVAVRISNNGTLFARSLYTLNGSRVQNFIRQGTLKPVKQTGFSTERKILDSNN